MRERRCRIWHEAASERPLPACGERVGVRGLGSSRPRPLTRSAEPVLGLAEGKTRGRVASPRFAGRGVSRRALLAGTAALAALGPRRTALAATEAETESHGLSTFGELKYPADFKHFDYVNPGAPKGGTLALQIKRGAGNQNFDTFNTLNIFVLKGDGAAGMDATFDSLMAGLRRRPGRALRPPRPEGALVGRQAHLPLPAASRSALPRRIAGDGAGRRLLDQHPEDQGPPELSHGAERGLGGRGRVGRHPQGPAVAETQPRPAPHRRRQRRCSRRPTGGTATSRPRRSSRRSAPAPTRSGGSSRGASSSSTACPIIGAAICR